MIHTGSTETSLFVDLLKEAEERSRITLTENQESYTVFMLMRFMRKCELVSTTLATAYLESLFEQTHVREQVLSDTGDAALLLAGLFPERAKRLNVSSSYFVQMSEMCFSELAKLCTTLKHPGEALLYHDVAKNVTKIAHVLYATRERNIFTPELFSNNFSGKLH